MLDRISHAVHQGDRRAPAWSRLIGGATARTGPVDWPLPWLPTSALASSAWNSARPAVVSCGGVGSSAATLSASRGEIVDLPENRRLEGLGVESDRWQGRDDPFFKDGRA